MLTLERPSVLPAFLSIHFRYKRSFFILKLLVYLGSLGRLVTMSPCWCRRILLSKLVVFGQVFARSAVILGLGSS